MGIYIGKIYTYKYYLLLFDYQLFVIWNSL